jgi:hypothetical protein
MWANDDENQYVVFLHSPPKIECFPLPRCALLRFDVHLSEFTKSTADSFWIITRRRPQREPLRLAAEFLTQFERHLAAVIGAMNVIGEVCGDWPEDCIRLVVSVVRGVPGGRKIVGGRVAEARMWARTIVVEAPCCDDGAPLGIR